MKFILEGEWGTVPDAAPIAGAIKEKLVYPELVHFGCFKEDIKEACRKGTFPDWMPPSGYGEILDFLGLEILDGREYLKWLVLHNPVWTLEIGTLIELCSALKTLEWSMINQPSTPYQYWSLSPYSH